MTIIFFIALVVYILICFMLVAMILMQEGKGGGLSGVMGASMGETFGFGGASKQIRKYTGYIATAFLILTLVLTFLAESVFRASSSKFIGTASPTATQPATPGVAPATATESAPPAEAPQTITITPAADQVITITPASGQPADANSAAAPASDAPAAVPASDAPAAAPASDAPAVPAVTPAP